MYWICKCTFFIIDKRKYTFFRFLIPPTTDSVSSSVLAIKFLSAFLDEIRTTDAIIQNNHMPVHLPVSLVWHGKDVFVFLCMFFFYFTFPTSTNFFNEHSILAARCNDLIRFFLFRLFVWLFAAFTPRFNTIRHFFAPPVFAGICWNVRRQSCYEYVYYED